MKAGFSLLIIIVLLLNPGCSKENNVVETSVPDPHPASILSYEFRNSTGIRIGFEGNANAVEEYYGNIHLNINCLDTVWGKITILDQDMINQCDLTLDNQYASWGFPARDTASIQFGFVPDSKIYKPDVLIKNKAVFRDLLGYEKNIRIAVVYVPLGID